MLAFYVAAGHVMGAAAGSITRGANLRRTLFRVAVDPVILERPRGLPMPPPGHLMLAAVRGRTVASRQIDLGSALGRPRQRGLLSDP